MPYQQIDIKAINLFQNGCGLLCFVSGVIADQCMNARERKQFNTLVSLPLEGEASENLKGCPGDPVHVSYGT